MKYEKAKVEVVNFDKAEMFMAYSDGQPWGRYMCVSATEGKNKNFFNCPEVYGIGCRDNLLPACHDIRY